MLRLMIAVLVLTLCSVSLAGSKAPLLQRHHGTVSGYGATSCTDFLVATAEVRKAVKEYEQNPPKLPSRFTMDPVTKEGVRDTILAAVNFASGYILGANDYSALSYDLHKGLSASTIESFIEGYCKVNPADSVRDAAAGLVRKLSKKR
jgi:hypothetical protein